MSGRLPAWLAQRLGVAPDAAGEGTRWRLETVWDLAPWATLVVAIVIVLIVAWCYSRESPDVSRRWRFALAALRIAAIAVLATMLAELLIGLERTGLPPLVVLVDRSASMATIDRQDESQSEKLQVQLTEASLGEPTRLGLAKLKLLEEDAALLRALDRRHKLLIASFDSDVTWHEGAVDDEVQAVEALDTIGSGAGSTRLGAAVRQVLSSLRGTPPAAVLVLTDGINTAGPSLSDAASYARRRGVPLYLIGIGDDQPPQDVELADLLVDEVVFAGDVVNFEATLKHTGFADRTVQLRLVQGGLSEPLAETSVTLGADGAGQKVRLSHRPLEVGDFEYAIEVAPLESESNQDNNRLARTVSVREEKVRVLLVQAYPNYEFRYLKHLLERDTTVELEVYLQEAALEYAAADESALRIFPVRRDDLFSYDVLIFGDVDPRRLSRSALSGIRSFVEEKGGGAIFVAGPKFLPWQYRDIPEIAALLPFDLATAEAPDPGRVLDEGFTVMPTPLGQASPQMELGDTPDESTAIWPKLPPLYWLLEISHVKPAARVLAEHPTRTGRTGSKLPVVLLHYVGAGKVVFHATDETWRWRFRVGDVFFARYWVQTIRVLARSKLLGGDRGVEVTVDRREYTQGEPVQVRVRFFDERTAPAADDGVSVVIEQDGGTRRQVTLQRSATARGIFEATLTDLGQGRYHVVLIRPGTEGRAPAADFSVAAPPGEFARLAMDAAALSAAADQTRGRFYRLSEAKNLLRDLPQGTQVPFRQLPPIVLWNRWWLLTLFLGLVTCEWFFRKRKGLM